jgi:putative toxin-antitoxin system antitoxin component (TIGR02293 family)
MTASAKIQKALFQRFEKELSNPIAMVLKATSGLPVSVFDQMASVSLLSKNELAALIHITTKTIENYRAGKKKLNRPESEQLLQLLLLYKKGEEILGSITGFNNWLKLPQLTLGGLVPFQLLYTTGGIQLILEELYRIEYGALA